MKLQNLEINWLGHSGFKIKSADEKIIYIDPFQISEKREKADIIFITHSHYDHCSIEDIKKVAKDKTMIICSADAQSKMRHIGDKISVKLAKIGASIKIDDIKIKCVPAYNLKKPFHSKEEGWLGYIFDLDGIKIYHAGDTDNIPEMKALSSENIDIALLPVGGTFTMNAEEAAKAAFVIKPKLAMPMHFGTIAKTCDINEAEKFVKLCKSEGIDAKILEVEKS